MFMNLAVVALVLSIAYAWMVRGVFSAMLQMICALIAGAIAFAVWEPLAIMLVNASPERGFLSFLESVAWGVALIIPFAVSFLLLRVISDKAVPNNIKNATAIDYAGGAIFGAGTGIISIGILVIGVGNMRVATNFLGYQPLWYSSDRTNGAGALVSNQTLWIPADKIVSGIYGKLSQSTMSSGQALGYWYPELELTGFASRVSPGDGAARNAMRPDDFKVLGTYTVGSDGGTDNVEDLLRVPGNNSSPKFIVDINEEKVEKGQVFGYVVEFEPGAKERGERGAGTLVISNGQVRLLVENDGQTKTVFPVAVISESSEPGQFGRWLFDAQGVYITSTGGKSKVPMGFEFVVPQGYTPVSLFVKNIRVMTSDLPDPVAYDSASSRDRLVRTGSILETTGRTQTQYNQNNTVSIDTTDQSGFIDPSTRMLEVLGSVSAKRNLTVSDENEIVGGQGKFSATEEIGRKNTPVSKNLRVERYAIGSGQKMIKLDVSSGSPFGLLTNAARNAPLDEPLKLIDENGGVYEAIGFEYLDREIMELRYTRGSTLTGVEDTPTLSTTREDQKLRIIFIITDGVKISRFVIGDTVIARFTPPIE